MPSNELETIASSIQDALHRAYALGRSDALRRVVEMVQADELGSKTVALLGHSPPSAIEAPHPEAEHVEAKPVEAQSVEAQPLQARPVEAPPIHLPHAEAEAAASGDAAHDGHAERADAAQREERVPPASVKDFLLDYLYPLGGKK